MILNDLFRVFIHFHTFCIPKNTPAHIRNIPVRGTTSERVNADSFLRQRTGRNIPGIQIQHSVITVILLIPAVAPSTRSSALNFVERTLAEQ